jgi:hypothetical protein
LGGFFPSIRWGQVKNKPPQGTKNGNREFRALSRTRQEHFSVAHVAGGVWPMGWTISRQTNGA